jgi:predicted transcriptional regulator
MFTDNGKLILGYMKEHLETEMWKAKDIGEGLLISSKTASGAMRKLVTDGFVEKLGENPSVYALTQKGKDIEII